MRTLGTLAALRLIWRLLFMIILGLIFGLVGRARAAVTLISFTATGMNGYILIEWETATELDNAGFYIQASDQENGTYSRINADMIFSNGDGLTGASYSYQDDDVTQGVMKWYKLESVALDNSSEFSDPISAIYSTSTPTSTPTPTTTDDQASSTNTPTFTPTLTPSATDSSAYPAPPTATSPYPGIPTTVAPYPGAPTTAAPATTATVGSPSNSIPTPTNLIRTATVEPQDQGFAGPETNLQGTLVPLPNITIQFPQAGSGTPAAQESSSAALAAQGADAGDSPGWSRYGTLGFILLIWALLGGWFWLSFRKLE